MSKLILKDGSEYQGKSFGANVNASGEVVFATGMVGYPESLTDPSYRGQILVLTFPLIGNYGVPDKKYWESKKIQVSGLVVCNYIGTPSHWQSQKSLGQWLKDEKIPGLEIPDTRGLTQKLRTHGVMLGKMAFVQMPLRGVQTTKQSYPHAVIPEFLSASEKISGIQSKLGSGSRLSDAFGRDDIEKGVFDDPNLRNLVAEVSTKKIYAVGKGAKTIALIDCGAKANIARSLAARGFKVLVVPWDCDITKLRQKISGVVISNGPGDPKMADATILNVKKLLAKKKPILGICLGNQILALAAGGTTYKLKFGHRSQNQPCVLAGTKRCVLTTQNHGFAVGKIPQGFKEWFYNANDNTNEGIIHKSLPFMSVQFHPEASPGPTDADWIFDEFIKKIK